MPLLQPIDDAPGYLKATLQGPQGSGKTRTAVELATECHRHFASKKPVAFFDTEGGSDYVKHLLEERTGMKPIRAKTRAFADLLQVVRECLAGASDILLVDSITHVWREIQDAYMKKANENRKWPKARMDIQDIMAVKSQWQPWPDQFLNAPLHMVVCGREGAEWGTQEDEETGKRELVQTGKKMKVEGEFGYEASLMIAMSSEQIAEANVKTRAKKVEKRPRRIVNVATVLKDRYDIMNGQTFDYPKGSDFLPFLERLAPARHGTVSTEVKSQSVLPDVGEHGWHKEKRERTVLCEEIQGQLLKLHPGQTSQEKASKADLLEEHFGTRSWTAVEGMDPGRLQAGLDGLRLLAGKMGA